MGGRDRLAEGEMMLWIFGLAVVAMIAWHLGTSPDNTGVFALSAAAAIVAALYLAGHAMGG